MSARVLSLVVVLIGLLAGAPAAVAQKVEFEKYVLPNGLTVILHPDKSLPIVEVNVWYHVGAKEEAPGRSGFAHLFEHLMFMGTQRVPGSDFDNLMEAGGGSNNASTSFDRTNYYSGGPASLLPTLLWLEADRLEDLGRTMTQEKLDRQREIVRNERRQSIENAPYGKAELRMIEILFPAGHPYHNEVIGSHADLEAATVADVKDFFGTFYVPRNASLVVAGDFDPAAVKPLIERLFADIAPGAPVVPNAAPPVRLTGEVRAVALDQVQLPRVSFAYHGPSEYAEGDAEMELLGAVLAQGKSSRLYRRLVLEEGLAVEVDAGQQGAVLQSVFRVDVTAKPGADLGRVEAIVDEEIGRVLADGVTDAEVAQRLATVELARIAQLQSLRRRADRLNEYEFIYGDPDGFERDLARFRGATAARIGEWARRVLTPEARLVMRVLPDEPERGESGRDERPPDTAAGDFTLPEPVRFTLGNGARVLLWERPALPLVSATLLVTAGGPLDPPAAAGRSDLTAQMLTEGAGERDAVAFADAVQSLGATLRASTDVESAQVSMTTIRRSLDGALGLMADAVLRPRFEAKDWERVRGLHLEDIKAQQDDPGAMASVVARRALFGDDHPYGWPVQGTERTVADVTLEAVRSHHAALFRPERATVLVAGDVTQAEAKAALERAFGGWKAAAGSAAVPAAITDGRATGNAAQGLRVVIVDRPDAVQTVVRYIAPAPVARDAARVPLRLMNTILGGSFTSRLNQNLREGKGYTYGARSIMAMGPSAGYFVAQASVRADVTGASLVEFAREFARLRTGDVTDAEVGKARETLRNDIVTGFVGNEGLIGAAAELIEAGLPLESLAADMREMGEATEATLNNTAKTAVRLDEGVLVLVGDKRTILPQLEGLGLQTPVEYTAAGEPVAK